MPIVSHNGDHTYSQVELSDLIYIERQVGAEPFKRALRNADDKDWEQLFKMIPDSGHGKFWKAVMTEIRAAMMNR